MFAQAIITLPDSFVYVCWKKQDVPREKSESSSCLSCNSSFGYRSPDINLNILRRGSESVSILPKADVLSHCKAKVAPQDMYLNSKDSMSKKLANLISFFSLSFIMFACFNYCIQITFYLKISEIFK